MIRAAALSAALIGLLAVEVAGSPAAEATFWTVTVQALNKATAQAQPAPLPPASVTATCTSTVGNTIIVSWTAVAHASTYSVYQSNSANGSYTLVSTVAASPWTTGGLALGTFFYKVTATVGTSWASVQSAASNSRTIALVACL